MSHKIYGVLDKNGCHIDVSMSELGAKRAATMGGYKAVSVRHVMFGTVYVVARKVNGKWVNEK